MSELKSELIIQFEDHRLKAREDFPDAVKNPEPQYAELVSKIDQLRSESEVEVQRKMTLILKKLGYANSERLRGTTAQELRGLLYDVEDLHPIEALLYYREQQLRLAKDPSLTASPQHWARTFECRIKIVNERLKDGTNLKAMYYGGVESKLLELRQTLTNEKERELVLAVVEKIRRMVKTMKDSVVPDNSDVGSFHQGSRQMAKSPEHHVD